jgi:hypothetical protein
MRIGRSGEGEAGEAGPGQEEDQIGAHETAVGQNHHVSAEPAEERTGEDGAEAPAIGQPAPEERTAGLGEGEDDGQPGETCARKAMALADEEHVEGQRTAPGRAEKAGG